MKKKNQQKKEKINFSYNLKKYFKLLLNYHSIFFWTLAIIIIVEVSRLADKFIFKILIDNGTSFSGGELSTSFFIEILIWIALAYGVLKIIQIISDWFRVGLLIKMDSRMVKDIKQRYFNHIVSLDYDFHTSNKTGSLISRMNRGSGAVENMNDILIFNFIPLFVQLIIVGISFASFSIVPAIIIFLITVVFVSYSLFIQQIQQDSKIKHNRAKDIEKGNISDIFTNIDSIKYFGKENWIKKKFKEITEKTRIAAVKHGSYYKWFDTGQILILGIGTMVLIYFSIFDFLAGAITIGTIVFIYTVYGSVVGSMFGFVYGIRRFYRAMADFQDLFNYGKIRKKIKDSDNSKNIKIQNGKIEFRDVNFKYGQRQLFENFNLIIQKNKKVAFVGHSGSGKTSLIKLLYRFYDIDSGMILVDEKNIKDVRQESLRSEMAIVPQECVLFDDTIYSNIAFSKPSASREEVFNAIKFAQLDKVIDEFPNKEKTIVGERGVKLSGGEKQRVSIARAILANKKILVLDEATSSLDSQTEYEIQQDLEKLMKGRTSIIVAHRLSTIMKADVIIVLDKGKIIQHGTHQELIGKKGQYKKLWDLQKGGYIK